MAGQAGAAIYDVQWCLRLLRRNLGLLAKTVAGCLLLAVVYLVLATPLYTATGELIFDLREPKIVSANPILQSLGADQYVIDSQVEVVRSLSVAKQVITKLGLRKPVEASEPSLLKRILSIGSKPKPMAADDIPQDEYEQFLRRLTVQRKGVSFVILVSYSHRDPVMAARITNAVMEAYTSEQRRVKVETISAANSWLQSRVDELRQKVIEAERKVQQFKTEDAAIDAKVMNTIYATFLTRLKETQSQEALQTSDARIVSSAVPPASPSSPKKPLTLGLALALGLSLGAMIALLLGMLDPVLRDAADVARASDLPVLAEVPQQLSNAPDAAARPATPADPEVDPQAEAHAPQGLMRPHDSPHGQALFALRQAVMDPTVLEGPRMVAVLSARRGEGRTTIALGLAREAAASGVKTVLVDADLRSGQASERVAPGARRLSLVDAVAGSAPLKSVLLADDRSALALCPAPDAEHAVERPTNTLAGRAFHKLIRDMRKDFELVVLDTPGFLDYPDARAMLAVLDRAVVVVDLGHTRRDDLTRMIKALAALPAGKVGLVINHSGRPPATTAGGGLLASLAARPMAVLANLGLRPRVAA